MNVLRHELRLGLRSALVWAASLCLMGLVMVLIFPSFQKDLEPLLALLKNYPPQALRAMGLSARSFDTFNGYYGFVVQYVLLLGCVQALGAGLISISREGARRTEDFLFTRTRRRAWVLLFKFISALLLTLLVGISYGSVTFVFARGVVHSFETRTFLLINGAFLLTQVFCVCIGFCVGCFARRIKAPAGVAVGLGALFFVILLLANMTGDAAIALISPMGYLNAWDIVATGGYDGGRLAALLALSALFFGAGLCYYRAKDLK